MSSMPVPCEAVIDGVSLPEKDLQGALAQELRNRRAAASCLRAAATTEIAADRALLRRRAARLIHPIETSAPSGRGRDRRSRLFARTPTAG
jgi:hypothetical protein